MKYFIITGTSTGFGNAVVHQLLMDKNNFVLGISRSENKILSPRYKHFEINLAETELVNAKVVEIFACIESPASVFLVNNAGTVEPIGPVYSCDPESIIFHFKVNILAPVLLSALFIRHTKGWKLDKGIINVSSGASSKAYFGWGCYCSSKAALEMFTRCLQVENPEEYRISSYDPGVVDTNMQQTIRRQSRDRFEAVDKFISYHSENKLITPKDAAARFVAEHFS